MEPGGNELTRAAREIGRDLARARESQGLSLADLSRRTKISVPTLVTLERGDFRHLPGGIYTRGLLRSIPRLRSALSHSPTIPSSRFAG